MSDLMIYGVIGEEVNALDVVKAIAKMRGKPVTMRINSPGGNVWDGIAIATAVIEHGDVSAFVDGIAASMASVIFSASKNRWMAAGTRLMIHEPWNVIMGRASEMRKEAVILDGIAFDAAELYAKATGGKIEIEKIKEMMDAETWLKPQDAVELGFAHGITGKAAAYAMIPRSMQYRNAPKEVALSTEENAPEPGLLDRMMAKLTGTESMRADLAKMETALAESVQRTMKAEQDLSAAHAAMEAMKAEHAAALEAARIEGAQAHEKERLNGSAPAPLPHVEESTEAFTTHTAKEAALRASGDYEAAGEYYATHKSAILKGE